MTKDEMIENMARKLNKFWDSPAIADCANCKKTPYKGYPCNDCCRATLLYDAGYRLIDGDDYVSIEWHNEQNAHAEQEIERLKTENEALRNDLINDEGNLANMTALYGEAKNSTKQTKIEVLELLANRLDECWGCYIPNEFESPTTEFAYAEKEVRNLIDKLIEEVKAE